MASVTTPWTIPANPPGAKLPDHRDLPCTDGSIVENFQEFPQGRLLTGAIEPILRELHPDGHYAVGNDSGIYFKITDPPLAGCRSPDWCYIPNVPALAADGTVRRSYVMWQEHQIPQVLVEYVSGNGSEERDQTPDTGKFWIYERAIRAPYYVILDHFRYTLEAYELRGGVYRSMQPNAHGHFPLPPLGVAIGPWQGQFGNIRGYWARFYDLQGRLLLTGEELAEKERIRAEQERSRAEQESRRANTAELENVKLRERLRQTGLDPNAL